MGGLELVHGYVDGTLPLNSMAKTLGYDIVEVSKGRVVTAGEPNEGHLNPAGTIHGGLAATLLDSSMGLAVRSMLPLGVCPNDTGNQSIVRSTYYAGNGKGSS